MANIYENATSFYIQGDGSSTTAAIALNVVPATVTYVSASDDVVGDTSANISSVTLLGTIVTVNFVAAFTSLYSVVLSFTFPSLLAVGGTVAVTGTVTVNGTVTSNIGTTGGLALDATLTGGTQKTKLVDAGGTNLASISATGALKVDGSAVTQPISGSVTVSNFPATQPVVGSLTNNNAAPAATNIGVLPAVASTAAPTYTNGDQVLLSTDLTGALRVNVSSVVPDTVNQGNQGTAAQGWFVELTDGTNVLGTPTHPVRTDPTGTTTQPVSGTVTTVPPANASTNLTELNSVALGSPSNYGTSPGAVEVQGVNAFITNTPAVTLASTTVTNTVAVNQTQLDGVVLGAPSNYGTSPGAVEVQGVNAFITNTPAVTLASTTVTNVVSENLTEVAGVTLGATAVVPYGSTPAAVDVPAVNAFVTGGTLASVTTVAAVTAITNALPTGANTIGKVEILGNTGATLDAPINGAASTNAQWVESAPSTASAAACLVGTQVALNVANIKASAGNFYGLTVANKASLLIYIQFYNTAGTPTLGTGVVQWIPVTYGSTLVIPPGTFALGNFATGIGIGAATSATGNGMPPVAPDVTIWYR